MSLLTTQNLGFSYIIGSPVLRGVNLAIAEGDRIGIAGRNGSGKTTLMRLLMDDLEPTEGQLIRRRGLAVAVLSRARAQGLSCGQQAQREIEQLLREPAHLLLLDEPTNHLDLEARRWLAARLARHPAACVVISHDRAFLNRVAAKTLWLERGKAELHGGNYDFTIEEREAGARRQWSEYQSQQRRVEAAEQAAARRDALANQMVKAPPGARHSQDFYARKASKVARTGRLLRERLAVEGEIAKPWEEPSISPLDFSHVPGSPALLAYATRLNCAYGAADVLRNVSFAVHRGERWAVLGPNGCGKTTLFRCLLGEIAAASGEVGRSGAALIGYYRQQQEEASLPPDQSPLQCCGAAAGETRARTMLACLRLPADLVRRPLASLSPGERAKTAIAHLLLARHNLLIFDEPTNHLEIEAQQALADALHRFPGAILFTSHDEWFLDAVATHRLDLSPPH